MLRLLWRCHDEETDQIQLQQKLQCTKLQAMPLIFFTTHFPSYVGIKALLLSALPAVDMHKSRVLRKTTI